MFQPYSNPHYPSQTHPHASSPVNLNQVKQSMSDLHHLIEQTKSMLNSRHNYATPKNNPYRFDEKEYYTQETRVQEQEKREPSVQIDIQPIRQNSKYRIKIEDKAIRSNVDIDIELGPKTELTTNRRYQNIENEKNRESPKYFRSNYPSAHRQIYQTRVPEFSVTKKEKSQKSFQRVSIIQPLIESSTPVFTNSNQKQISQQNSRISRQNGSIVYGNQVSAEKSRSQSPSVFNYRTETESSRIKPALTLEKKVYEELILNEERQKQEKESKPRYQISKFSRDSVVGPRNDQKKLEKKGPAKTVRVDLKQRNKTQNPQKNDQFLNQKAIYLNKLRREQQLRTNRRNSHSGKRNYSLSPECERVTNRLYYAKTNKQPCLKLQRQKLMEKMQKMQIICKQHRFIRRYLTDRQILEMMAGLEKTGVPQQKWPMKIIDKIYSKLKFSEYPQHFH